MLVKQSEIMDLYRAIIRGERVVIVKGRESGARTMMEDIKELMTKHGNFSFPQGLDDGPADTG